ncbi:hypothetical protein [Clostridium sp.]|uniref:hypothetical protein n=1 Tax=Clostridium sp. TaxID=1506 RepID=UPI00260DBA1E|nr:hypothetical protein [Clostridium sp.]
MITVNRETTISLKDQLKNALVEFSYGKLNENRAEQIADKAMNKFDYSNSALNHKGMNWYAKEILNLMGIKNNKYS